MDRSFLSDAAVVTASRSFVCMRLLTYENAEEVKFLKALLVTRSGEVENSLFAVLAPDGKEILVEAGRSPRGSFRDAAELAARLQKVAKPYSNQKADGAPLPILPSVRLALNVAACDRQPLVIIAAEDAQVRKRLKDSLCGLAWSADHVGRYLYVETASAKELAALKGVNPEASIIVVQSDTFGLGGKALAQTGVDPSAQEIAATLQKAAGLLERRTTPFATHVREGHLQGVFWEPVTPVTDPKEIHAREHGRTKGR